MNGYLPLPAEGKEFKLVPAGNHLATCFRIIDLGTQINKFDQKLKHKINISWELPGELNDDGKPMMIGKRYTYSSHEKSTLRQDLESWRGRPFSKQEFGVFDIAALLGVNCFLNVLQEESNGSIYSNIHTVSALPKGMNIPVRQEPVNPKVIFSLGKFDQAVYDSLSDRIKATIAASPEYKRIKGLHVEDDGFPGSSVRSEQDFELEDSIPF